MKSICPADCDGISLNQEAVVCCLQTGIPLQGGEDTAGDTSNRSNLDGWLALEHQLAAGDGDGAACRARIVCISQTAAFAILVSGKRDLASRNGDVCRGARFFASGIVPIPDRCGPVAADGSDGAAGDGNIAARRLHAAADTRPLTAALCGEGCVPGTVDGNFRAIWDL